MFWTIVSLCVHFVWFLKWKRKVMCSWVEVWEISLKSVSQLSAPCFFIKLYSWGFLRCCSHISFFYPSLQGRESKGGRKSSEITSVFSLKQLFHLQAWYFSELVFLFLIFVFCCLLFVVTDHRSWLWCLSMWFHITALFWQLVGQHIPTTMIQSLFFRYPDLDLTHLLF